MMIFHDWITTMDRLRNNIYTACDGIALPVCPHHLNAHCFALSTAIFFSSLNLFLPQITLHSRLITKQNSKQSR